MPPAVEINESAPAVGSAEIEIVADPDVVWEVLPLGISAVGAAMLWRLERIVRRRALKGHCPKCGYDLHGLAGHIAADGAPTSADRVAAAVPDAIRALARR